jgi:hypothetical protein
MDNAMHSSPETEAIRQRMEEVRCDLDEDVQEIVEGARDMGDWRYYVKAYPWICLGGALVAGYLIVPGALGVLASVTAGSSAKGGPRARLLSLVGDLAMRSALNYAEQQAGKLFAPQAAGSQALGRHSA